MSATLAQIAAALRTERGLLADAVIDPAHGTLTPHGDAAAAGPRARADPAAYAFAVEAVHEGQRLHAGTPRIVHTDDPDLALLAGDRLYALGLACLAGLGDLDAIVQLTDVISLCARAQVTGDAALAAAAWEAGAAAVGHGADAALEAAKIAARSGDPSAPCALRAAARQLGGDGAPTPPGANTIVQR